MAAARRFSSSARYSTSARTSVIPASCRRSWRRRSTAATSSALPYAPPPARAGGSPARPPPAQPRGVGLVVAVRAEVPFEEVPDVGQRVRGQPSQRGTAVPPLVVNGRNIWFCLSFRDAGRGCVEVRRWLAGCAGELPGWDGGNPGARRCVSPWRRVVSDQVDVVRPGGSVCAGGRGSRVRTSPF